ncbi:hypothetical protein DT23_11285 [Thioclava indica]|uniref:Uncharacterized protein n=1 Tax=Thioclava indica TaxID=1353528 RepID=A0A074JYI3_9RHOB|nr:hypothetical protein DT23_11285 [Thioclava indica]
MMNMDKTCAQFAVTISKIKATSFASSATTFFVEVGQACRTGLGIAFVSIYNNALFFALGISLFFGKEAAKLNCWS